MRIGRFLSPAAAPIALQNILHGFKGCLQGQKELQRFQLELKNCLQVRHCFLISSGKAALTIILRALHGLRPKQDEVLIPAFTCYSVPSAIVQAGLKVRLCDVHPQTLDFDFEQLELELKDAGRILAIISPHLFGLPADIRKVQNIVADREIAIIEDAAQALGGSLQGKPLGTWADVGFFSLGRGKPFSTVQGGIIVTDSEQTATALSTHMSDIRGPSPFQILKYAFYALALNVLIRPQLFWLPQAIPGLKLGETIFDPDFAIQGYSSFQAGLAKDWIQQLNAMQEIRKKNVQFWQQALQDFSELQIVTHHKQADEPLPLIRFPVLMQDSLLRNYLLKKSQQKGLGIMPAYPDAINSIQELELHDHPDKKVPGAKACARQLVTLPVHNFVSDRDRQRIILFLKNLKKLLDMGLF